MASAEYREFEQGDWGETDPINPADPVQIIQGETGIGIAWRIAGEWANLAPLSAVSVCRFQASKVLVSAFSGLAVLPYRDEGDLLLRLDFPASPSLPVVVPGQAALYEFCAAVTTASGGIIITAPIVVAAIQYPLS